MRACKLRTPDLRTWAPGHPLWLLLALASGLGAAGPARSAATDLRPELSRSAAALLATATGTPGDATVDPASPATNRDGAPAEPLTLDRAHELALRNHPDIAAADFRANASLEVYRQARSGLLPQANLYATSVQAEAANTRILAGGLNNPSVINRTALGGGLSQLITDFGRTSNLTASAHLHAQAAQESAHATREEVLLGVDRSFFGVLQAQAMLRIARQTLDTRQLLADRVSVLAENKLKSELDVSFAKVGLEDARLLLLRAQNELDSARAALSAGLGLREERNFVLVEEPQRAAAAESGVDALIAQALELRPDLRALRAERDAAQRTARAMRDERLPTVSAVVTSGTALERDPRLPGSYAAGGIQFSVPLFAGGLYLARQNEAEQRSRAAAESLRSAEDAVSRDVRIAWLAVNSARERARTAEQLARYAGTAYELSEARYQAGSSSIVELSQAQLELTSAQIGAATSRYEVLAQEAALRFQTGILSVQVLRPTP